MAVGTVIARIASQYSDKGSKAAQKDLMKLGKQFDAYAKKATRAVGLVAVAAASAAAKIGKDSVMAASDVSQQFGALDAVFGKNAEQLKEFSKGMVEYGLSTADAARYAALLGTQLKGLGLEENDAIARTKELEILAADLAATYGGTTADAVQALSSTFKGEYNPIERYGVAIRKSDITARLAAQGLKGLKGETLKAAEAQAAYELIIMKTTAAQGQSKREYNTLAAQLQRLRASYSNITASLGEALLPVIQEFANYILVKVVPAVQAWVTLNRDELAKGLQDLVEIFKDFMIAGGKFLEFLIKYDDIVKILTVSVSGLVVAFRLWALAAGLGGILTLIGKINKRLGKTKIDASLTRGSKEAMKAMGGLSGAMARVKGFTDKINAKSIFSGIAKNWKGVLKTVGKKSPWITLGLYIDQIATFFYDQIPGVKYVWDWIFNYGKNRITEAIDNFKKRFEFLGPLMEKVKPLWDGFYKYATMILGKIVDSLRNTWLGKLLGFGNEVKAKITLSADAQAVEDSVQAALKKTQTMDGARTDYLIKEEKRLAAIKEAERKRLAALEAKNAAAQAKSDAAEAKRNSVLNNLKKLGVKVTTSKTGSKLLKGVTPFSTLDPKMQEAVQFQAAYLLLLKQNNIAEAERIKAIAESKKSTDEAAKSLQRYSDILTALADNKISSEDVAILAKKWDMTTQQAASYIITALSVNKEGKVTTEAVDALSKAWGSSKEQAEKYLDFTLALADNVLSDKEIAKLQEKWGLTEKQVRQYADFTVKIADYKLDDTEINDLMGKWGLTREEVLKYVAQIGAPVSWNGQLTDPADEAERKWKAALAALMAYQAALAGVGSSASSSSSSSSSSASSSAASTTAAAATASAANAAANASKAAADAYAAAKAKGDMNAAAIAAAGVTPSALAAGESGAIGAASIAAQLRAAETALAVQKNATTLANFRAKEAADLAASQAAATQLDYDERSKFRSMTLANASSVSGTSGSGAVTVNLTVNGSVSTEKDLVATVRQGLLAGQYNGQTLTLEAI
jgi:hypothetical protein